MGNPSTDVLSPGARHFPSSCRVSIDQDQNSCCCQAFSLTLKTRGGILSAIRMFRQLSNAERVFQHHS